MAGFKSVRQVVDTELNGGTILSSFRKTVGVATPSGIWLDLSMFSGTPVPNFYAASSLVGTALSYSSSKGLYHGGAVSPLQKVFRSYILMASTSAGIPMPLIMQDYLLYYPFADEGDTEEQFMDNTVTLPRYTDGAGVQIMVISQGTRTGGALFTVKYTNQDGVSGRVTEAARMNTNSITGSIATSSLNNNFTQGPYLTLQDKDTGVRSIESVTFQTGDTGVCALVLVKPVATTQIREQTAPVEVDFLLDRSISPVIQDDAYLNFICLPPTSLSGQQIMGLMKFAFN
jgi:hypothetical protein